MSLDQFIDKFGGWTEKYLFYNGTVELRYDPKKHVYLLVTGDDLVPQNGVTSCVHIIDKSEALIPWGCKMMALKLLNSVPSWVPPGGTRQLANMTWQEFEHYVLDAKSAHKEKLEEAAGVGQMAHNWIETYIKAVLAQDLSRIQDMLAGFPPEERASNAVQAALQWMSRHLVKWVSTERKIYSRRYGYAGTLDGLALVSSCDDPLCCPQQFTDRLSVIDWKTSNYLYMEYMLQTAAYEQAYEEESGEDVQDRWIIRLGKADGEFEAWHLQDEDYSEDFNGFLNCLMLLRSVESIKARIKARADNAKKVIKERAKAAKEEALKIKCKKASTFKGTRKPRCNSSDEPCQACAAKYAEVQAQKDQDALVKINMKGKQQCEAYEATSA